MTLYVAFLNQVFFLILCKNNKENFVIILGKMKKLRELKMIFINSSKHFKIKILKNYFIPNDDEWVIVGKFSRMKAGEKSTSDFSELARHEYRTPPFFCTGIEEAILYIAVCTKGGDKGLDLIY